MAEHRYRIEVVSTATGEWGPYGIGELEDLDQQQKDAHHLATHESEIWRAARVVNVQTGEVVYTSERLMH